MKQVHFSLQSKGGVGKSLLASLVTQYIASQGLPVIAFDIDPTNATLFGYKKLPVRRLDILKGRNIDDERFDEMIDQIIKEDSNFVVDNGASSFVAFTSYIAENKIVEMIHEGDKQVYVHMIIKAGQDFPITMQGLNTMFHHLPEQVKFVVWLNYFSGEIVTSDGKPFEETKIYKKNKDRVHGIVKLKHESGSSHGRDMKKMLESWLTFDEVGEESGFSSMAQRRLNGIREEVFSQLEKAIQ